MSPVGGPHVPGTQEVEIGVAQFIINPSEPFGESVFSVPIALQALAAPSSRSRESPHSTHSDCVPALSVLMVFKRGD